VVDALRTSLAGLTTRGRCLLAAGLTLALCSVVLGQRDLLRAAVFLVALPLAALAIVSRSRYRLACVRSLAPPRVEAGHVSTVQLQLDNVSRLPSGVLLMEDALPYTLGGRPRFVLDKVEPRGVRQVTYPVRSEVRGRYRVGPLSVRLTDPFGLCELARSFASSDELVVTPVLFPLPAARLGGDWTGGGDAASRSVAVSGSDDAATREYRHGDDLRKVHWKSTARTGELMVRREEQPFQSRATLLLDSRGRRPPRRRTGLLVRVRRQRVGSIGVTLARPASRCRCSATAGGRGPAGRPPHRGDCCSTSSPSCGRRRAHARQRCRGAAQRRARRCPRRRPRRARRRRGGAARPPAHRLGRLRRVVLDADSWAPTSPRARAVAAAAHDDVCHLLLSAGWRVLPVAHGTPLAQVWPLAGGSSSVSGPSVPTSAGPTAASPTAPSPTPSTPTLSGAAS
jgi:hypothetical protein